MTMDWIVILVAAAASLGWFVVRPWWQDRQGRKQAQAASTTWAAERGPPLTPAEVAEFRAWHAAQERPFIRLDVGPNPPLLDAGGTRIGGPAALPPGASWPLDRSGRPMEFLAQIDFADLPPLPDFPARGVLQFFIAADDYFGCDFDDPLGGDFRVIWRGTSPPAGALTPRPAAGGEELSPLSAHARTHGIALVPTLAQQRPGWSADWAMRARCDIISRQQDELEDLWESDAAQFGDVHHIGGYPDFTQVDFRGRDCCPNHDVVLLQLWSEPMEHICWGDVGQANFMVSRADLIARDFSRVSYQWDCT
jgi:uncharacterized protein YwqG